MVAHNLDFCRGVAMVLQGESLKAGCYVGHSGSLGTLREKMVSSFVRHETPERYRVETGLVRDHAHQLASRQCDLLVHEPHDAAPLYRWEDFVVVHASAARAVIEVKSNFDQSHFHQFLDIHTSVEQLNRHGNGKVFIPTFGYGLDGVTFDTFAGYIQGAVNDNRLQVPEFQKHLNWPVCVAVQAKNYVGIRSLRIVTSQLIAFCLVNLAELEDPQVADPNGVETGIFLDIYAEIVARGREPLADATLYEWFNKLPVRQAGKVWVTEDGAIHTGNIPEWQLKTSS